jgi:aspartate carbamoyltransferase catalytic subunit
LVPSLREYTAGYGLTARRADLLAPEALIMHPGPMNRGVEIAAEVADRPNAVIVDQVRNGVAVRMAVLFLLLGSGPGPAPGER